MDADVAVVGLGSVGSMVLWQLARRQVDVIGFEQHGVVHERGGYSGDTRLFRTAYLEGPEYVPILKCAYREWRKLEAETGQDLLRITGALYIGRPTDDWLAVTLKTAARWGLSYELVKAAKAAERYPQHALLPREVMVLDRDAGYIRSEFAVAAALLRAQELGASIQAKTKVESIRAHSDRVLIETSTSSYTVRQVVIAAGAWMAEVFPELSAVLRLKRIVLGWFYARNPADYVEERFPVFRRWSAGMPVWTHGISGVPTLDGGSVRVSLNGFPEIGSVGDMRHDVSDEDVAPISDLTARFLPGLVPEPLRARAYMDAFTPDGHSMIGRLPNADSVSIAAGLSGHGFKMAPAFGKLLAEHCTANRPLLASELFRPDRFRAIGYGRGSGLDPGGRRSAPKPRRAIAAPCDRTGERL